MKNQKTILHAKRIISAFVLAAVFLSIVSAQGETKQKSLIEKLSIKSKALNEERIVTLSLPENYNLEEDKYPVIYLLDGRAHIEHTQSAVNYLTRRNIIPPSIIVSIHNIDRNRDFSPVHDKRIPTSGGADNFLKFLSDELAPYIYKNYRASDYSMLIGHSFGGTFAVYSLLEKPQLFDAYIAISPYIHYVDKHLVKEAESLLKSSYNGQKSFYMTVGDEPDYFEALGEFSDLVKEKSAEAINFDYVKMKDENHGSIPYLSVYKGLRFNFSDWQLSKEVFNQGLKAIDEHYKQVSRKYGMEVQAPENAVNLLGYNYLGNEDFDNAIKVFTENVKRFPKSSNVYDSLGEAYEKSGKNAKARENYQKAVELGKKQNSPALEIYKKNLARVQGN